MGMEFIAKLIAVAGSVFALYKVIVEFVISKKSRLREEFKFIKEFIDELESDTHPFIIEKGYLAITGDTTLRAPEITYLLSHSSPAEALKKFSVARKYLEFKEACENQSANIKFRNKYTASKRKWVKRRNVASYILFATLAFAPIAFVSEIVGSNWQAGLVLIAMSLCSFGPLAYISIAEYGRVLRGEELVESK